MIDQQLLALVPRECRLSLLTKSTELREASASSLGFNRRIVLQVRWRTDRAQAGSVVRCCFIRSTWLHLCSDEIENVRERRRNVHVASRPAGRSHAHAVAHAAAGVQASRPAGAGPRGSGGMAAHGCRDAPRSPAGRARRRAADRRAWPRASVSTRPAGQCARTYIPAHQLAS